VAFFLSQISRELNRTQCFMARSHTATCFYDQHCPTISASQCRTVCHAVRTRVGVTHSRYVSYRCCISQEAAARHGALCQLASSSRLSQVPYRHSTSTILRMVEEIPTRYTLLKVRGQAKGEHSKHQSAATNTDCVNDKSYRL
jgi:hypothetical protein